MVTFVGAGPGHKELITVKGMKAIQKANCIIFAGSLVNPEILEYASLNCEIYDSSMMTLEQVIEIVLKEEERNHNTVRLHTGDPSIYGAIREQIDLLKKFNISYEIIPGVSSFLGAAAAVGVEYTLPNVSQTVVLTRMQGRTPVPHKEDIVKLASIQASMVIFLSTGMLSELSIKLIEGGYKENSPATIVYKATWPDELIIKTTIKELPVAAKKAGINKTALILVGDFLGDNYDRSLLYHPDFTHAYRNGSDTNE